MAAGWAQDAALDLLRDGDRVRRGALLLAPSAKAEPVEGGYDISGRWSFASGSSHAEWIAVTAMVDGARPPVTTFILDADAVTIHDNWHVTGLKGSGSADVSVDHAFAPSENILAPAFGPPLRGGPVLRMGQPGLVVCEHVGFALGVARRMLDEITELGRTKARGLVVKKPLAENNQFQAELGQADVRLRATRAYALDTYDRAHRAVAGGATLSDREQLDLRLTGVLATDVALDICNTLIRYAGTTGLYSGNPIERAFRDIHAGSNHHLIAPEAWEAQGRTLLGDDSVTPLD
jgi:indole-3-acetate monooxygenase